MKYIGEILYMVPLLGIHKASRSPPEMNSAYLYLTKHVLTILEGGIPFSTGCEYIKH